MLAYETPQIVNLIVAAGIAYVLGALPIAERVSRRRGIDIFNIGTGLAGSTNVLKNVGRVSGAVVFLGDMAKGIVAVFVAQQLLGIEGPWIVVPTTSAIIGQWNSVFSGFKGGDGLVVLGGATLAVFPEYGIIGVALRRWWLL
jgi:glycerol-3-phosphate acyltransferase PlsY